MVYVPVEVQGESNPVGAKASLRQPGNWGLKAMRNGSLSQKTDRYASQVATAQTELRQREATRVVAPVIHMLACE